MMPQDYSLNGHGPSDSIAVDASRAAMTASGLVPGPTHHAAVSGTPGGYQVIIILFFKCYSVLLTLKWWHHHIMC